MKFLIKLWNLSRIFFLMAIIRIGLRIIPLSKLLPWLSRSKQSTDQRLDELQIMTCFTDRLLTLFPYHEKGNCLPRTCILYWLAPRYGFSVKFHCGIRKGETGLDGHAWLTMNGQPFLESTQQSHHMVETFSYPKR